MKKISLLFFICFFTSGCNYACRYERKSTDTVKEPSDVFYWEIIQSPDTGRCYEVARQGDDTMYATYGYMGMSEIPCDLVEAQQE